MMAQAVARARVRGMIAEALNPETPQRAAALEAVRAICLIDAHRLLDLGDREEALCAALTALVVMLEVAVSGCIHAAPETICGDCRGHMKESVACARRAMIHVPKEGS